MWDQIVFDFWSLRRKRQFFDTIVVVLFVVLGFGIVGGCSGGIVRSPGYIGLTAVVVVIVVDVEVDAFQGGYGSPEKGP